MNSLLAWIIKAKRWSGFSSVCSSKVSTILSLGQTLVIGAQNAKNVPEKAKEIASLFQTYVRSSAFPVYDKVSQEGFWRVLCVRIVGDGVMAIVQVHPQQYGTQEIHAELKTMMEFVKTDVQSLHYQISDASHSGLNDSIPTILLHGLETLIQELCNVKFTVSSTSFFQINTSVAELMYSYIKGLYENISEMLLLDLCCGTGTIGQVFARSVGFVVGVDVVESSILDAKKNAAANGLENVEYFAGKCEDVLHDVLVKYVEGVISYKQKRSTADSAEEKDRAAETKVEVEEANAKEEIELKTAEQSPDTKKYSSAIAILDPPRSGVSSKVIQSIRSTTAITQLVFVACDADQSMTNVFE